MLPGRPGNELHRGAERAVGAHHGLVVLVIVLFLTPVFLVISLVGSMPATFAAVGLFLLSLWQYHVLVRPDVRRLFLAETTAPDSAIP